MATGRAARPSDQDIVEFLRTVAVEGYETDEMIVELVSQSLLHDHPEHPDLQERVAALAPALFDELQAREAGWPIPTDNDRLDRAFVALDRDGILTRQNWYQSPGPAAEEMDHEVAARRFERPIHGFAFFHGGDIRRALAGEGLHITWGAVAPRQRSKERCERASWDVAQDIHRALWAQGLSPQWSRVIGEPITLPFTWRRRRRRWAVRVAGR